MGKTEKIVWGVAILALILWWVFKCQITPNFGGKK